MKVEVTYEIEVPDGWMLDSNRPVTIDKGEYALIDGRAVLCSHSASAGKFFRVKEQPFP